MKIREGEPSCSMRTDGQMDMHDEANSQFSKFCERATKKSLSYPQSAFLFVALTSKSTAIFSVYKITLFVCRSVRKIATVNIIGPIRCTICFQFISISSLYMFGALICLSSGGTVYTTICIYGASCNYAKHVQAINRNKLKANSASCWSYYTNILRCTVNKTLSLQLFTRLYLSFHMEHLGSHWTDFHGI
jgi:hypothetical protein